MKVYFNNSCKICRSEINLYKKENIQEIDWVDITNNSNAEKETSKKDKQLLRRLHVKDGNRVIEGAEALNIAINLSDTDSSDMHFSPKLYNGKNNQLNFALLTDQHPVNVGGTVTQSSALALKSIRQTQNAKLNYDIEVLYP